MGVLLVVIYLTILRPNDDNSVSGVNAPGGVPPIATTAPQRPHHPSRRITIALAISPHGATPRRRRAIRPRAAALPRPRSQPRRAPVGGSVPTSSPSTSPGPGHSPTDDQYDSTLARLRAALH